ncbi:SRPBCC domain-containing protein [Streptomyces sp. NBC_01335]|uniref:CoxG family protein n=1 Tax=Streptomyces sp. NBC_01335 TaxID=2903828 RepID=UPI002E10FF91|nr:SRPBCC domain-containing protein [Streptomyces sp. NBC_01335]
MEHEVFVPVPVASLRSALGDPVRVARCVPSLQQDAAASEALAGRLRFRVDGHTITYRGALELTATDEETVSVTGEGTAARGAGTVKLALTIALEDTAGEGASGTTIRYSGTATGDGRLAEIDAEAVRVAARRLLDRFTQQLVTESLAAHETHGVNGAPGTHEAGTHGAHEAPADTPPADTPPADTPPGAVPYGDADSSTGIEARADAETRPDGGDTDSPAGAGTGSLFDAPVPPPSLDAGADIEFAVPDEPPAEAAHARRTMIGRSAEEVDHAPPRGRYAPVPSPETTTASSTLRWVAPAAALALASAVVVGRALRRRR